MSQYSSKELFKLFKNPPWQNRGEFGQFVSSLPKTLDTKTIKSMLEVISDERDADEPAAHEMRLEMFRVVTREHRDPALFLPLVKAIKNGDSRTKELAASLIPTHNSTKDHAKLIVLLKAEERSVRQAAVAALRKIGGRTLLTTLDNIILDKDFTARVDALDLLVPLAGHHAVGILKKVLQGGTTTEKLKVLGYLSDEKLMGRGRQVALRAMLDALEDPNDQVSTYAVREFAKMATEEDYWAFIGPLLDSTDVAKVRAAVIGLGHFNSPRAVLALERKLRVGPTVVRIDALSALEQIGNDSVLPLLAEALGHTDLEVRKKGGEVLSALSNARKVDVARSIIWLLNSNNVHVRRMAVDVARTVKDPDGELWPRLLVMLRDEDWWVRERVMDALVEMAGTKLTPHMVQMLQDPADVMRRFAVDVLGRLKDTRALGALIQSAREDGDWWVKEKAVEAIAKLADSRAVSYIVDLMNKDEQVVLSCLEALTALKAENAAPYVVPLLKSADPDVRASAIHFLGEFDASQYALQVQPLIADVDAHVARVAQEQLVRWNVALSEQFSATRDKAVSFLDRMLMAVADGGGDDLILASDRQPHMKRMGKTVSISKTALTHAQVMAIITPHLSISQMEELEQMRDVDFSYAVNSNGARFRVNVFRQETGYGAVFRTINANPPELHELGLPEAVTRFGDGKWGLILVGGPTGSGKSTTLAAIINYINCHYERHIITIEDPIEVVHKSVKGLVTQRELGTHAKSTASALRATLREDPDVILVGEMRDLETISFAINAAETGHLVFGTLHTVSADTSIDRIINAYPSREQDQVRATLADNLQAVVCQHLIKRKDGKGRVVAAEVMLNTSAVANLIRSGKTYQIPSVIATSKDLGMQSMDGELLRLYREGVISSEDVYMKANSKKEVEDLLVLEEKKNSGNPSGAKRNVSPEKIAGRGN